MVDLDEDYEAIYKGGWRDNPYDFGTIPVGLSPYMCSISEMQERERCKRLHKYEIEPGTNPPRVSRKLAMTEYSRSSAGRETAHSSDLRPWSVLDKSLKHLLLNICFKDDDWMFICDFVFDRLKAIRQEMVIQRIEGSRYIKILEGSLRFLIYSMYKLTCTLKDYSKVVYSTPIISMDGQVTGLDNYEMNVIREMKLTMQCIRDCMRTLIIQYQENVPDSPNRPIFEALNLIVNMPFSPGFCASSTEYQANRELRNSNQVFKTVFRMYRDHLTGFHLSALKRLPQLIDHPILLLAYASILPQLQIHLIARMRRLYASPGSNQASIEFICRWLCPNWLDDDTQVREQFVLMLAIQFGIYNVDLNICDFRSCKKTMIFKDTTITIDTNGSSAPTSGVDNETRSFALQLILGRDWFMFQEALKIHGLETILDPERPV